MNSDTNALSTIDEINDELQDFDTMEGVIEYIVNKEDFLFTFKDLMIYIKNRFEPEMDLTFMNYFMDICRKKNEFYIHHSKLKEYGVINNIDRSNDIKKCLDNSLLKNNKDFLLRNVTQQENNKKHGGSNKKEYYLKPSAFKLCLMRAKNTKIYAKYYIFLEECVSYYDMYNNIKINKDRELERIMHEEEMMKKDSKISKLTKKKLSLEEKMDKMQFEMKKLLHQGNEVLDINKHISNKLDDTNLKLDVTNHKLDVAVIDRVPKTVNKSKLNCFVLLKNHDDTYYTIRCQRRRITSTLKKYKAKFDSDDQPIELLRFDYNPNSINLVNRINPLMTGLFASFATVHL